LVAWFCRFRDADRGGERLHHAQAKPCCGHCGAGSTA
jgi:hypothetical protein